MNTRLKQFLAAENITQAQFADTIEVVRASVSHVLSGRNNPGYDFIKAIMTKYPRLNMEWLMFGKGKMYKDQVETTLFTEEKFSERVQETIFPEDDHDSYAETEILRDIKTADDEPQVIVNQRKVAKIIILYDDGSYQEM